MTPDTPDPRLPRPCRVLMLGATGTAGQATARALLDAGHEVACFIRPGTGAAQDRIATALDGADLRFGDVTDPGSLARDGIRGERFDALVSCLASRTGAPADAWAIDHRAHSHALKAAQAAGIRHMVLLSAICVQKPVLAFQHAKLAFEADLIASGLTYSIVRPTALFKSLSGQIERLRQGKPFLVFGDGALTASKPISDGDLGRYMAGCLTDPARHNRILPIGGPGPAITPLQQGAQLFTLLDREPKFRHVPVALLDAVHRGLRTLGHISPKLAAKAELARIGRYYATESMLVWDPVTKRYDADATPQTGTETLFDFYAQLIDGRATIERGAHKVF